MRTTIRRRVAQDDEGFTLIELLVVVLILGILMAIAIPTFLSLTSGAKTNSAEADLTTASQDEAIYLTQYGDFDGTNNTPSAADNVGIPAVTPPGVVATDPGINWSTAALTSANAGTKTVSVSMPATAPTGSTAVAPNAIFLETAGQNGNLYWVYDNLGALTYFYGTAATVPTTVAGWATSWKLAT